MKKDKSHLFLILMDLLRYNLYTIRIIYLKCTIQCCIVYFQNYVSQCKIIAAGHCHHCKRNPIIIVYPSPFSSPQYIAITNFISISIKLPILDISYKYHLNRYGFFGDQLLSFIILYKRFIHATCTSTSFLSTAK